MSRHAKDPFASGLGTELRQAVSQGDLRTLRRLVQQACELNGPSAPRHMAQAYIAAGARVASGDAGGLAALEALRQYVGPGFPAGILPDFVFPGDEHLALAELLIDSGLARPEASDKTEPFRTRAMAALLKVKSWDSYQAAKKGAGITPSRPHPYLGLAERHGGVRNHNLNVADELGNKYSCRHFAQAFTVATEARNHREMKMAVAALSDTAGVRNILAATAALPPTDPAAFHSSAKALNSKWERAYFGPSLIASADKLGELAVALASHLGGEGVVTCKLLVTRLGGIDQPGHVMNLYVRSMDGVLNAGVYDPNLTNNLIHAKGLQVHEPGGPLSGLGLKDFLFRPDFFSHYMGPGHALLSVLDVPDGFLAEDSRLKFLSTDAAELLGSLGDALILDNRAHVHAVFDRLEQQVEALEAAVASDAVLRRRLGNALFLVLGGGHEHCIAAYRDRLARVPWTGNPGTADPPWLSLLSACHQDGRSGLANAVQQKQVSAVGAFFDALRSMPALRTEPQRQSLRDVIAGAAPGGPPVLAAALRDSDGPTVRAYCEGVLSLGLPEPELKKIFKHPAVLDALETTGTDKWYAYESALADGLL